MSSRTTVVIVYLGAIVTSIAAGTVAFQMSVIANADKPMPDDLPALVVMFLLFTVALLAGGAALQKRGAQRHTR